MPQFSSDPPHPAWITFAKRVLRRMVSDQNNAAGKRDAALQDHPKSRLLDTLNDLPRAQPRDSAELD